MGQWAIHRCAQLMLHRGVQWIHDLNSHFVYQVNFPIPSKTKLDPIMRDMLHSHLINEKLGDTQVTKMLLGTKKALMEKDSDRTDTQEKPSGMFMMYIQNQLKALKVRFEERMAFKFRFSERSTSSMMMPGHSLLTHCNEACENGLLFYLLKIVCLIHTCTCIWF